MRTIKIGLNELRTIVKQIIKEEIVLNENNLKVKKLTNSELEKLTKVLNRLKSQFDEECYAEMFDYDNDFIDVEVTFEKDLSTEQFKVDRKTMKIV